MKNGRRWCVGMALVALLAVVFTVGTCAAREEKAVKQWTVLVYLCADNDLAMAGVKDLNEMETVGSTDDVNIVVQFDGSSKHSPGYEGSKRYYVVHDEDMDHIASTVVEDLGEVNMGKAETLYEFLKWGISNYPARKYFVVLWNHGDGWYQNLKTSPLDFTSPGDVQAIIDAVIQIQNGGSTKLSILQSLGGASPRVIELALARFRELKKEAGVASTSSLDILDRVKDEFMRNIAIDEGDGSPSALSTTDLEHVFSRIRKELLDGGRFELIGFDACLMGMMEVAYELRHETNYILMSEKTEPGDGWAYDRWLAYLAAHPRIKGRTLSKAIIDSYTAYYSEANQIATNPFYKMNTTLACFSMKHLQTLADKVADLADYLGAHKEWRNTIRQTIVSTQHVGEIAATNPVLLLVYTAHRDLYDFLKNLRKAIDDEGLREKVKAARDAYRKARVGFRKLDDTPLLSMKNAGGMTIYLPMMKIAPSYAELSFSSTAWGRFLASIEATDEEVKEMIEIMQNQKPQKRHDNFRTLYGDE